MKYTRHALIIVAVVGVLLCAVSRGYRLDLASLCSEVSAYCSAHAVVSLTPHEMLGTGSRDSVVKKDCSSPNTLSPFSNDFHCSNVEKAKDLELHSELAFAASAFKESDVQDVELQISKAHAGNLSAAVDILPIVSGCLLSPKSSHGDTDSLVPAYCEKANEMAGSIVGSLSQRAESMDGRTQREFGFFLLTLGDSDIGRISSIPSGKDRTKLAIHFLEAASANGDLVSKSILAGMNP